MSVDLEKPPAEYIGDFGTRRGNGLSKISTEEEEILHEFTPQQIRKVIHRIDRRLVTTVGLMYCISLMDRTNLSAAAIAG